MGARAAREKSPPSPAAGKPPARHDTAGATAQKGRAIDDCPVLSKLSKRGSDRGRQGQHKDHRANKKAYHDYFVEESFEAGIELKGTEVKSLRAGRANSKDAWCSVVNGEMMLNGCHISPYDFGNIFNPDPMRVRRLLMHKKEILRLYGVVKQQGYSLIPLSLYFKDSRVKVQVGLCRGKKLYDKRADMAEKAAKRDIERTLKERNR